MSPTAVEWNPEIGRRKRGRDLAGTISGNFGKRVRLYIGIGPWSRKRAPGDGVVLWTKSYLPLIQRQPAASSEYTQRACRTRARRFPSIFRTLSDYPLVSFIAVSFVSRVSVDTRVVPFTSKRICEK